MQRVPVAHEPDWPVTRNGSVPIGVPYPHLDAVVVGPDLRPADEGELCVRGTQRFGGYLDPADNRNKFYAGGSDTGTFRIRDGEPVVEDWYRTGDLVYGHDGMLVHLGRIDRQAKLRGHRIELEEVEGAMRDLPGIVEAVVVVRKDQLYGFYVGDRMGTAEIRGHLRSRLPAYMIPVAFRQLPELPLTPAGNSTWPRCG